MNIINTIVDLVNEIMDLGLDNHEEVTKVVFSKYGMSLAQKTPEERARVLAFIGLLVMDLALGDNEGDGTYATATLTARSIVKSVEVTLAKLGIPPDFLRICTMPVHHPTTSVTQPATSPLDSTYDDSKIIWN